VGDDISIVAEPTAPIRPKPRAAARGANELLQIGASSGEQPIDRLPAAFAECDKVSRALGE
jgi:hypothetical protein